MNDREAFVAGSKVYKTLTLKNSHQPSTRRSSHIARFLITKKIFYKKKERKNNTKLIKNKLDI